MHDSLVMAKLLRALVGKRATSKPKMSGETEAAVANSSGGEMNEVTEQTAALSLADGNNSADAVPFEVATFALS